MKKRSIKDLERLQADNSLNDNLINKSFCNLFPVQVFGIIIASLNTATDSVLTGQLLGTETLAAVGLFVPFGQILSLSWVIITGLQILCTRYLGQGNRNSAAALFTLGAVALTAYGLIVTALCLMFAENLSALLGASGSVALILRDYIIGYAPGIWGQVIMGLWMCLLPFNNDTKRSYWGTFIMVVSNLLFDLFALAVLHWGVFGLGLASAGSYLLAASYMALGFRDKTKPLRFNFNIGVIIAQLSDMRRVLKLGSPSLMFNIGNAAKSYIMNMTLLYHINVAAVAVMNVQGSICGILGAIPMGCANAYLSLASYYNGERDLHSFRKLTRYALKIGLACSAAAVIGLMLFSEPIADIFFEPEEEAYGMALQMLFIFPSFLIFNCVLQVLLRSYQCRGNIGILNMLNLGENLAMALFVAVFTPLIGINAAWLSFPVSSLICLCAVAVSVYRHNGKIAWTLNNWLKLRNWQIKSSQRCIMRRFSDLNDVVSVAQELKNYCLASGAADKYANLAALSFEEYGEYIIAQGLALNQGKISGGDVYLTCKHKVIKIRIRVRSKIYNPPQDMKDLPGNDPAFAVTDALENHGYISRQLQKHTGVSMVLIRIILASNESYQNEKT